MNKRRIDHSEFHQLIGEWSTEGRILGQDEAAAIHLHGTDRYEVILDGYYILHQADVRIGEARGQTHELIGLEGAGPQATFAYFNNQGASGHMVGLLEKDHFTIEGEALRFRGELTEQGNQLVGVWQQLHNQGQWKDWMEIRLRKSGN